MIHSSRFIRVLRKRGRPLLQFGSLTVIVICLRLYITGSERHQNVELTFAGSKYGGWWYNAALLDKSSVIYSFGLGEDTSWDEAILHEGFDVYGFDPTPKSAAYVLAREELRAQPGNFHFTAEGLYNESAVLTFTMPLDPSHVSLEQGVHDNRGPLLHLKVDSLRSFMGRNGHKHIDVLKLDIESSEYDVLEGLIRTRFLPFTQLLVEFHQRFASIGSTRHDRLLRSLQENGFRITHQHGESEISFQRCGSSREEIYRAG